MTKERLAEILDNHKHWLNEDCEGWQNMRANLRRADLYGADLSEANLYGANLYGADISENESYRKGLILREDMIGYKKCRDGVIVTLKIPKGSVVFCINGSKCRTNSAEVVAIDGAKRAYSQHNGMSYYVGDRFNVWNFDCIYNVECSTGIHFFRTREEAENY